MTAAPLHAPVAAAASLASAPRHSTPSGSTEGWLRDTTRTDKPSPDRWEAKARPILPAPNTTCSGPSTMIGSWCGRCAGRTRDGRLGIVDGATVPVLVVGTEAEHLGRRPQGREDQVLDPDGRGGH